MPAAVRRWLLSHALGYDLDRSSRIHAFVVLDASEVHLGPNAAIGPFTVCRNLERLFLAEAATIGKFNWITGVRRGETPHYVWQKHRKSTLELHEHAAITHRHIIDCTDAISIGAFSIVAGYRSQFLTHGIDIERARQTAAPITVGRYCFIGTNCVLLAGSSLPDCCVLGAKSLLNKRFEESYRLYGGVPASPIKALPTDAAYFSRKTGFVT
jgi:acetyltransferase-like isoleucine patch superfamily enzyme